MRAYAQLLHLYPASYRKQFAEPMLQTFVDVYNERQRNHENMRGFVTAAYTETALEILKQHMREAAMASKTTKAKIFIAVGGVGVVALITGFVLLRNQSPQVVAPMSSLEHVRQISQGKKDACLPNNPQAREAVEADDIVTKYKAVTYSNFEMAASEGIMDVPAGTDYDLTVNSYQNGTATGSLTYEKDYGTYNYTIKKQAKKGEWKFVSMIACNR